MLTLDDFQIELLAFELRFEQAYLIWDHAGALWSHMVSLIPDLKLQAVQPNQQVLANRNIQLTLELGLLRLNVRGPKAASIAADIGQELYGKSCSLLRISTLTRVGFRSIRTKVYRDQSDALAQTKGLSATRDAPPFIDKAELVSFTNFNRYESDSSGLSASIKLEKRDIDITAPWEVMPFMTDIKRSEIVLYLDADYYTIGGTGRDSFSAEAWIPQADKATKRYWTGVLK